MIIPEGLICCICLALGTKLLPNGKKCVVIHCVSYELGEFIIRQHRAGIIPTELGYTEYVSWHWPLAQLSRDSGCPNTFHLCCGQCQRT